MFETYWTTQRGVEVVGNSCTLLDLTVYGRQEPWRFAGLAAAVGQRGFLLASATVHRTMARVTGRAFRNDLN